MTDITKKEGGLKKQRLAKIATKKMTLKAIERAKQPAHVKNSILLGDISGSMDGNKIDGLKQAMSDAWRPGISGLVFNSDLYELEQSDIPQLYASGGTSMMEALQEAWARDTRHIILITDGEPTDAEEDEILDAARMHKHVKIDTVGIADLQNSHYRGYNREFLRELADITGGKFTDCDEPLNLSMVIEQLLLSAGHGAIEEGGAIQL